MDLSSGGATVTEGMEGTALGRLFGSFGGGFFPVARFWVRSTFDWNNSRRLDALEIMLCSLKDRKVSYGAGDIRSEIYLRASNVFGFAVSAVS